MADAPPICPRCFKPAEPGHNCRDAELTALRARLTTAEQERDTHKGTAEILSEHLASTAESLAAAEARVEALSQALREIDQNATLPEHYDPAEWWKHVASKRREVARAALACPPQRDPMCVERWPECSVGAYDPRCCRFPKSCSCWPCLACCRKEHHMSDQRPLRLCIEDLLTDRGWRPVERILGRKVNVFFEHPDVKGTLGAQAAIHAQIRREER